MTTDVKPLLNAAVTAQAAGLAIHNLKIFKKRRQRPRDIIGLGVTNIVGTNLLKAQSDFIGGI